jgi:cAMP phosphodiesterase
MSASKVRRCPRMLRYHYVLYANTFLRKQYTDASSRNVRFKSVNPFEVLDAVDSTDGDAKNSSAGSADTLDHDEVSVRTPVKEQTRAFSHSAGQYQVSVCVVTGNDDGDDDSQRHISIQMANHDRLHCLPS